MMRRTWLILTILGGITFGSIALAQVHLEPAGPVATTAPSTEPASKIYTWGDQGDGTYRNPVLKTDFSDPDILRVGQDFYLIASDFHYMGMQILHSRDLVNWTVLGQIFHSLNIDPKYDQMQGYGQGTWAPSLRYHDGQFFIYVCTPYDGLLMFHAKDAAGPWTQVIVKRVQKWEDPCPLWDEDGKAYLVHGIKGAGPLMLHTLSPDGTQLLDDGREIYHGANAEGPKFYKRHGYYYICLPEGGVATGGQTMLRSKNIYGPYERREVLHNGQTHQGGLVELDNGQAWFISFKQTGFLGRICYLNPVTWGEDDWPVFGDHGQSVTVWKKPDTGVNDPPSKPEVSDEFDSTALAPIWQWNHNPVDSAWSLSERPGFLRLHALPAEELANARNTLTQKLWDDCGGIDITLDTHGMADGQRAGLTFVSGMKKPATAPATTVYTGLAEFFWIGVVDDKGEKHFCWQDHVGPVIPGDVVRLTALYVDGQAQLAYSTDGQTFTDIGQKTTLRFGNWKGARIGLFSYGPGGGVADFDAFHYQYFQSSSPLPTTSPSTTNHQAPVP